MYNKAGIKTTESRSNYNKPENYTFLHQAAKHTTETAIKELMNQINREGCLWNYKMPTMCTTKGTECDKIYKKLKRMPSPTKLLSA